eukprot:gene3380-7928_t
MEEEKATVKRETVCLRVSTMLSMARPGQTRDAFNDTTLCRLPADWLAPIVLRDGIKPISFAERERLYDSLRDLSARLCDDISEKRLDEHRAKT